MNELIVIGIVSFVVGAVIVFIFNQISAKTTLAGAKKEANQLLTNAERDVASMKKEAKTELKEHEIESRERVEKESERQRAEVLSMEQRILSKEENLDQRMTSIVQKTDALNQREKELDNRSENLKKERSKIEDTIQEQILILERISGLTIDAAKKMIVEKLENEVRRETALRLKKLEDEMVLESEKKAKKVLADSIQRCASDHIAEHSVSVVALPSEEMKGRIIGREGRNIRALETATGINLIVDDTPEAVVLSGFDPIRREIAKITMERLISDGRIHPARIEELVEKVTEEMETRVMELGNDVCLECDVHGLHPEIVRLMGRLHYRTSYGQNVLRHSQEVCYLSGLMAAEIGEDVQAARRAGLIHDMGKAPTHEVDGSHALLAYDLCKKHGETELVANAVGAHHNEIPQDSVIAVLVQAADALSAARPGARREMVDTYIKRLKQLEEIADEFNGVEKSFAIQAGREVRIVVRPKEVNDAMSQQLARDVARKIETDVTYPGQIKVTVVRETRASDVAK